jgi:hypothetical protein
MNKIDEEQLVRPDFGSVLEFCVRERAAITYAFDILEAMGGEIMTKMDTLEGIMFRVMTQAHTLRANARHEARRQQKQEGGSQ